MATVNKNLSEYNKNKLPNAEQMKFGIVVSEWNEDITNGLLKGAKDALLDCGVQPKNIVVNFVPGSYELIYTCNQLAKFNPNKVDGLIAIGSVIQGETKHFNFVCDAVSQGIKDINILTDTPTIFCVLTDNTHQQSVERSGGKHGNKGTEAAIAAIKMAHFKNNLNA